MANPTCAQVPVTLPPFEALFHRVPEVAASAPGRVNLMGDHTDYNGGYVLPMVIPQETCVELALRQDHMVHVWSASVEAPHAHGEYQLGQERPGQDWLDFIQAVTAILRREGHQLPGLDLRISSSVPLGAGLSSSASLLVALLRAIGTAARLELPDAIIARLAHRAETEFVGAPVGIMDQMVCALGRPGSAFFLDVAAVDYEHIPLPASLEWVVIHSGVRHSHATGSYQERRKECEAASALLGVQALRDLEGAGQQAVLSRIDALPPPLNARARHVVTENERVLAAVDRLRRGDLAGFGAVMDASHCSLRQDFEVSVPETDLLVDLAHAEPGVYGARLTGGGFGGSVVIAAAAGMGRHIATRIAARYRAESGRDGTIILPLPAA